MLSAKGLVTLVSLSPQLVSSLVYFSVRKILILLTLWSSNLCHAGNREPELYHFNSLSSWFPITCVYSDGAYVSECSCFIYFQFSFLVAYIMTTVMAWAPFFPVLCPSSSSSPPVAILPFKNNSPSFGCRSTCENSYQGVPDCTGFLC